MISFSVLSLVFGSTKTIGLLFGKASVHQHVQESVATFVRASGEMSAKCWRVLEGSIASLADEGRLACQGCRVEGNALLVFGSDREANKLRDGRIGIAIEEERNRHFDSSLQSLQHAGILDFDALFLALLLHVAALFKTKLEHRASIWRATVWRRVDFELRHHDSLPVFHLEHNAGVTIRRDILLGPYVGSRNLVLNRLWVYSE